MLGLGRTCTLRKTIWITTKPFYLHFWLKSHLQAKMLSNFSVWRASNYFTTLLKWISISWFLLNETLKFRTLVDFQSSQVKFYRRFGLPTRSTTQTRALEALFWWVLPNIRLYLICVLLTWLAWLHDNEWKGKGVLYRTCPNMTCSCYWSYLTCCTCTWIISCLEFQKPCG